MPITFDRSVCCDLNETISREWLVTNGMGGYAAGTVAGVLTRMEHGLLVALPPGAQTPQLLLAKLDEEVVFDQRTYYLGTNEYRDGTLSPSGFVHLESFRLEEGFPIFTYHLGGINGIMLEKRIWMPYGRNTTFIQYRTLRTATYEKADYGIDTTRPSEGAGRRYQEYTEAVQGSLTLTLLPLATHRQQATLSGIDSPGQFQVQQLYAEDGPGDEEWAILPRGAAGCIVRGGEQASPYHILAVGQAGSQVTFLPTGIWYWNFLRRQDARADRPASDDLYLPGVFRATLRPGEETTLTLIVTAEELSTLNLRPGQVNLSYKRAVESQRQLLNEALQPQRFFGEGGEAAHAQRLNVLPLSSGTDPQRAGEDYLHTLLQAGERFLLKYRPHRPEQLGDHAILFGQPETVTALISEFYNMEQRVRDALIALPGLTLVQGRFDEARQILRTIGRQLKYGLLPERLALSGTPVDQYEPAAADTTLWYFYALDHYLRISRDYELLHELYPQLVASIEHYVYGKAAGIALDARDGLLVARLSGKALTWMNATVDGEPVTPRAGKPVEVNALWFHALSLMQEWSQYLNRRGTLYHAASTYQELLTLCQRSFQQRYWHEAGGYLYDVVDGPDGSDSALRPNQLLACSLRYPVLEESNREKVLEVVTRHLLTPAGLRTLAPGERGYRGRLGSGREQARALHQGSAWTWLIGPYIDALLAANTPVYQRTSSNLCVEYLWRKGLQLLEGFQKNFQEGLLAMSSAVYDGDEPQQQGHCAGSALATAELLRSYYTLSKVRTNHPDYVLC